MRRRRQPDLETESAGGRVEVAAEERQRTDRGSLEKPVPSRKDRGTFRRTVSLVRKTGRRLEEDRRLFLMPLHYVARRLAGLELPAPCRRQQTLGEWEILCDRLEV